LELNIEEVKTTNARLNIDLYGGSIIGVLDTEIDSNKELISYLTGSTHFSGIIKLSKAKSSKAYFKKLGLVPNLANFHYTYLTVGKELNHIASIHGIKNIPKKINQSLSLVGLDETYLTKKYNSLSTSEHILINLAPAILKNPDLLIFDYVLNYLNKEQLDNVFNIIKQLKKRGKLVLIFDYNVDLLFSICNKFWCINQNTLYSKSAVLKEMNSLSNKYLPTSLLFIKEYNSKTNNEIKPMYELNDILKAVYRDE